MVSENIRHNDVLLASKYEFYFFFNIYDYFYLFVYNSHSKFGSKNEIFGVLLCPRALDDALCDFGVAGRERDHLTMV